MGGGTEAFPDLGEHCQYDDCNQLDFLPFTCTGCHKVFCMEHRTYISHACSRADHNSRTVAVCELCSASIEKQADEEDEDSLSHHRKSGTCDPTKKKKPRCPVLRCREILTFSNSTTCKVCNLKIHGGIEGYNAAFIEVEDAVGVFAATGESDGVSAGEGDDFVDTEVFGGSRGNNLIHGCIRTREIGLSGGNGGLIRVVAAEVDRVERSPNT